VGALLVMLWKREMCTRRDRRCLTRDRVWWQGCAVLWLVCRRRGELGWQRAERGERMELAVLVLVLPF
jgi:hypothetical protein